MKNVTILLVVLCLCTSLLGCAGGGLVQNTAGLNTSSLSPENADQVDQKLYRVQAGDSLRIDVYQEEDLSRIYKVDESGAFSFPLIGPVKVSGLNIYQIEDQLRARLKDGYLVDPSLSVGIEAYRPFSILGEVNAPGSYDYIQSLSVADAVAKAGGFTYRAQKRNFEVLRREGEGWNRVFLEVGERVLPGDVIYVNERLF